ncbi:PH domain-containing protein [Candidatus Aenigmatarchaeota archaeon]
MVVSHEGKIIGSYHITRFRYIGGYILFVLLFVGGILLYSMGYGYFEFSFPIGLAIFFLVALEIKIRSTKIIMKERDVVVRIGLLSKKTTRIRYHNITDIHINQTFLQRVFKYGDIEIGVPGATQHHSLTQHFKGKGAVHVGEFGKEGNGLLLKNIQNVKNIERKMLSKARERAPQHRR